MQLHKLFGALVPFVLVALVQFYRSTLLSTSFMASKAERKPAQAQAKAVRGGPAPFNGELNAGFKNVSNMLKRNKDLIDKNSVEVVTTPQFGDMEPAAPVTQQRTAAVAVSATASAQPADPSRNYPPPTKSSKRLIDGSPNWLPVPNAEGQAPDDLAWHKLVRPGEPCPPGRKPFHTILTAQASLYQQWQTKIFYYHFRRAQREGGACTEMSGFTRLLAGREDELTAIIPTVSYPELGHDKTRGFPVINRPWTIMKWLEDGGKFKERVTEDYVYIAETDHLLRKPLVNRATPQLNVAFFFPYMSPKDPKCGRVAQKWLPGLDKDDMPPVGPSPAMMHVDILRKLAPLWYDLSVKLKADREADGAFGWMLEMWGYAIAACQLGVKHFVWQQLQIEPSAAWHQDVKAQDPFIYHYTFGVEYNVDGTPVVGGKGAWSLDKRNYFGAAPPQRLSEPPECAQECGREWRRLFNEATGNMSAVGLSWYERTGADTQRRPRQDGQPALSGLSKEIVETGPWLLDGGRGDRLHFFRRGVVWTPWGGGTWRTAGPTAVTLSLCGDLTLTFDSASAPSSFTYTGGKHGGGRRDPAYAPRPAAHEAHPLVARLLGEGPWAFGEAPISGGPSPFAFLRGGVVATPNGPAGSYAPLPGGGDDELAFTVNGVAHRLSVKGVIGCYQFNAFRDSDKHRLRGWVMMRHVSMEYTGWRDGWGCQF